MHEKASVMRTEALFRATQQNGRLSRFERTDPLVAASLPIWRVAKGWVLLFPMLYLAMNGNILPSSNTGGSATDAGQRQFIRA